MFLLLSVALASGVPNAEAPSLTPDVPAAEPVDSRSAIGPGYRTVSPVVSEDLSSALLKKDWPAAIELLDALPLKSLNSRAQGEHAFLLAWCHLRNDTASKAVKLLPRLESSLTVPAPYLATVRAELFLDELKHTEALAELEKVPVGSSIYPRAAVLRAETLQKLDRRKEASEVFAAIASRADPAPGNALALLALAYHHGPGTPEAYPHLRRLWTYYPTSKEARTGAELLRKYAGKAEFQPTAAQWSLRAEQWMKAWSWNEAIQASDQALKAGKNKDEATCRALYVKGRSHYKKNQLSNAITAFADAGTRCEGVSDAYGAKSLYITGTAQFRKKQRAASAATFAQIPTRYPKHSMADDGYTHGGISLQENGDLPGAQAMWQKALDDFPEGDTAAEATWRLAWSQYVQGDTAAARKTALALSKLSTAVDAVHADAGRYWYARWAMYPNVEDPTTAVAAGKAEAVEGWASLLEERPFSFYSILAASRLAEVDSARLKTLQTRGKQTPLERPWEVRTEFLEHAGIQDGVALARLGMSREARLEWKRFEPELEPDEAAWLFEMRAASGDWLFGHAAFRAWIKKHPVGSLGDGERAVVRVAYPDRYWDEVQKASTYDTFEPRLFHALVREESNFNRKIVSFAGARGLSQLMPATAKQTAGWMKRTITMTELFEPQKNLDIGGRYLHTVHKQLSGSPYCALAGYNAGPGRVNQWKGEWGNIPTDEYVERIPFRETRGYVKRVMGTWQTYRWYMDEGEPFVDLSKYNHQVLP